MTTASHGARGARASAIETALTAFTDDLVRLIQTAIVDEIRSASPVATNAPASTIPYVVERWPRPGTQCHRVLAALHARPDGMAANELQTSVRGTHPMLFKALAKLRGRGLVRATAGRSHHGMRYFAVRREPHA